jgi:uncharacterized protein with FMN-binding domain
LNRAPIVLGSTAVGLGLVLAFHTHSTTAVHITSSAPTTSGTAAPGTTTAPSRGGGSPNTAAPTPTTSPASRTRSATGQDVTYQYGDIQLKVTEVRTRISNIEVVQNDASDPRSAQINSIAVPMLTSQALAAQSSQIDGVSGASYTSAAYSQALQSAIDALPA